MSSEVSIRELTGARRELRLRGAGLPLRGQADWGSHQRVVTTWPAGNGARATQHVLGPIEAPTKLTGEWNTTRLLSQPCGFVDGDGPERKVVIAHDLALLLEDIVRSGSLLRVTWITQLNDVSGPREVLREGRALDFSIQPDTIDDIVWSVSFEWVSRGDRQQRAVSFETNEAESALFDINQAAFSVADALEGAKLATANRLIPKGAQPLTIGQFEQLANAPSTVFRSFAQAANLIGNRAKRIGDLVQSVRTAPYEVLTQALDVARNAQAVANQFVDAMTSTPPEEMTFNTSLSSVTRAASYFGDGTKQAQYMARQSTAAQQRLRAQQQAALAGGEQGKASSPLQTGPGKGDLQFYLTRPGDTLIGLALKFYGTEAGAIDIATANALRLTTAVVPPRMTLLIPPLSTTSAAQTAPSNLPFSVAPATNPAIDGQVSPVVQQPGLFP